MGNFELGILGEIMNRKQFAAGVLIMWVTVLVDMLAIRVLELLIDDAEVLWWTCLGVVCYVSLFGVFLLVTTLSFYSERGGRE